MSQVLQTKIASVRRKHSLVAVLGGIAAIFGLAILLLSAGMLLDWMLEFPRWVRAALLSIDLSVIIYILLVHVLSPVFLGPDEEEIALMVERAIPEFRTRLIASVQLARPAAVPVGASQALATAMIRQTEKLAEPMDFAGVVKAEPAIRTAALAGFVILAGFSAFLFGGDVSADLVQRAFLSNIPVPRNTRVICETKDRIVAIGDSVSLEAKAQGVYPTNERNRWVKLSFDSGRKLIFPMDPIPGGVRENRFGRTIENVQESFTYFIRLNDGHSETFKVQAVPRPAVVGAEFVQSFPAYTHRQPERRSPGDLLLLAGSKLQVKVKASKAVRSASIHLVGVEQDLPMTVGGPGRMDVTGTIDKIPAKGLVGFSVRLVDDYGLRSTGETVYPVDVLLDKDPTVRIIWPDRKEETATQQAKLLLSFEATDDFGIAHVFVRYRIDKPAGEDKLETGEEKFIELDLSGAQGDELRRLKRRYEFDLANLKPLPPLGSVVEYWVEVQDGNDVTGPGKAVSDRFRARVVSDVEKRADLNNRLNDQLTTIDYVTQDEEKLNQNLGALILEKK